MYEGIDLMEKEREGQVLREGYDKEHDDQHINGELADAAVCYILNNPGWWPWELSTFKYKDRISSLVKAGALLAAEIERLQRAEERNTPELIEANKQLEITLALLQTERKTTQRLRNELYRRMRVGLDGK